MAYTEDTQPSGLSILADLADNDTVIVGDTSDASEVVKTISWTNLKSAIKTYYDSVTSTLTNKIINADNNTISNLAHGAEVDNPTSGVHGVTGSVVGTTDSQTLTNKTIDADNNTISNIALGAEATGAINDLSDVTITTPANNEVLAYDGVSAWINQTPSEAGLQAELAEGAFVDGDKTKLDGIEAGADVTDTANVTAAGALMDSEVDADIKTLALPANTTISTFGASLVDDADAATARTTLDVDQAGTDNSTDVTLAGTPDYITITGQVITRNQIDLTADVANTLPVGNLPVTGADASVVSGTAGTSGNLAQWNGDGDLVDAGTTTTKLRKNRFAVRLVESGTDVATGTTIGGDYRISDEAITVVGVGAWVDTAGTTGVSTIDINEGGTTILSTKITIDSAEKTSETAATAPVISDSSIAADGIITIDVDGVSTTAPQGLVVWIDYYIT